MPTVKVFFYFSFAIKLSTLLLLVFVLVLKRMHIQYTELITLYSNMQDTFCLRNRVKM